MSFRTQFLIPAAFLVFAVQLWAQSTQCLISGYVRDQKTGQPVEGATVSFRSADGRSAGMRITPKDGSYELPLLTPGVYRLRSEKKDVYQPREFDDIVLAVAALVDVNFEMRPLSDVFEQDIKKNFYFAGSQRLLNFYGPDIDTSRSQLLSPVDESEGRLTTSISDVIDPEQISQLPLTGRDIYTALLLEPGVNADPGATRGLGFSVNGQRPSASSFLLDGVETNAYLISGPLLSPAPEMVQEYRISTNNFSAEYGGTSGYIANAVTHAGSSRWHGNAYYFFGNEALNANGFQQNFQGFPKPPLKQSEPGFQAGGPLGHLRLGRLGKRSLFTSDSFEYLRLRTRLDPVQFLLPTAATYAALPANASGDLLRQYKAAWTPDGPAGEAAPVNIAAPSSLNQYTGVLRLDAPTRDGQHQFLWRAVASRFNRPDYFWTPFPQFTSGFSQNAVNIEAASIDNLSERDINEVRVSWNSDLLNVSDNSHGLPQLNYCTSYEVCLPSSTSPYGYRDQGHTWQALDNISLSRAHHNLKFGGGFLNRQIDDSLRPGADGYFGFTDMAAFLSSQPYEYTVTVSRDSTGTNSAAPASLITPDYNRTYRYRQFYLFAQDSWKVTDRLALNFGVRYDYYGAPVNIGRQKDALIALGSGSNIVQSILGASYAPMPGGDQPLFAADPHDWAPRIGVSWSPWHGVPLLLRGSYGIFYDRPFDNLWQTAQNNGLETANSPVLIPIPYLSDAKNAATSLAPYYLTTSLFQPTVFQPGLRNGMVQSAFLGAQSRVNDNIDLELNGIASRGRGLLTTDFINRQFSVTPGVTNPFGYINQNIPTVSYRANQGSSNYTAATATLKFHNRRVLAQVAYTLSHSIDNQSDPLAGDFNLQSTSVGGGYAYYGRAAFVQQFNSAADRGNSDFDQRQNFVFYAIATLPARRGTGWAQLLQNWRVAALGSLRSGLPFNAYADTPTGVTSNLIDNRADLVDPANAYTRQNYPGGALILNPAAFGCPGGAAQTSFGCPGNNLIGTAGRNAFAGPGTINANLMVSRTFGIPHAPETMHLVVRADAYNFLNHANLYVDAENPSFPDGNFGTAQFGNNGVQTNFPVQVPLTPTPRILQLGVRLEF